jgi:hypothetical protein
VRAKHRHEAMKQFKWTYYSFLGLLASSLISSYLSLLFLCILVLVWLRGGDFNMKLDFLLRNWHYPAMSLVMLVLIWMHQHNLSTEGKIFQSIFAITIPLIIPTLKSLNFTYNKRIFINYFIWASIAAFPLGVLLSISLSQFTSKIIYDPVEYSFSSDLFYDVHLRLNSIYLTLIQFTAALLLLEFFNINDAKRKNAFKVVQLIFLMFIGPFFLASSLGSALITGLLLYYGYYHFSKGDNKSKRLAKYWFIAAGGLAIFDVLLSALLPSYSSGFTLFAKILLEVKNYPFVILLFFALPLFLLLLWNIKQKNKPNTIWLTFVIICWLPLTYTFSLEFYFWPHFVTLSLFLPFMNMLKSEAR